MNGTATSLDTGLTERKKFVCSSAAGLDLWSTRNEDSMSALGKGDDEAVVVFVDESDLDWIPRWFQARSHSTSLSLRFSSMG